MLVLDREIDSNQVNVLTKYRLVALLLIWEQTAPGWTTAEQLPHCKQEQYENEDVQEGPHYAAFLNLAFRV